MKKIKVLHVIPNLKRAGAERLVAELFNLFKDDSEIEIKLFLLNNENEFPELINNSEYIYTGDYIKLSVLKPNSIKMDGFLALINSWDPDIIHTHLYEAEVFAREVLFRKIKYVSHFHSNYRVLGPNNYQLWKKDAVIKFFEKYRLKKRYQSADNRFIAVSNWVKVFLESNVCRDKDIFVLPNFINVKKFHHIKSTPPSHSLNLITTGNLNTNKNHQFLLKVVHKLSREGINANLTILGDGVKKDELKIQAQKLQIANKINFEGVVMNVEDYLKSADLYVHSSLSESFGISSLEAMAAGCPVVALDAGGNADIIQNGKNGYLIKGENISAFCNAIKLCIGAENYLKLSMNANETAKQYDANEFKARLKKYYSSIL